MKDETVVVLAAGRGSRMGTPKALMLVEGRPWWQTQLGALGELGLTSLWVVSDEVLDSLRASRTPGPATIRASADAPMFASVMAALTALESNPPPAVFLLPVDVPVPSRAVWESLSRRRGAAAAPTHGGSRGHPLRLSWDWVQANLLPLADEAPSHRLDHLVQRALTEVDVDDPGVLTNLNSPRDVERWIETRSRARHTP